MYVTDIENKSVPVKAIDLSTDTLAGTVIFEKAIFFPKNDKLLTAKASFTLTCNAECFIAGVAAGKWTICNGERLVATVETHKGENIIAFAAEAGGYTISPVKKIGRKAGKVFIVNFK